MSEQELPSGGRAEERGWKRVLHLVADDEFLEREARVARRILGERCFEQVETTLFVRAASLASALAHLSFERSSDEHPPKKPAHTDDAWFRVGVLHACCEIEDRGGDRMARLVAVLLANCLERSSHYAFAAFLVLLGGVRRSSATRLHGFLDVAGLAKPKPSDQFGDALREVESWLTQAFGDGLEWSSGESRVAASEDELHAAISALRPDHHVGHVEEPLGVEWFDSFTLPERRRWRRRWAASKKDGKVRPGDSAEFRARRHRLELMRLNVALDAFVCLPRAVAQFVPERSDEFGRWREPVFPERLGPRGDDGGSASSLAERDVGPRRLGRIRAAILERADRGGRRVERFEVHVGGERVAEVLRNGEARVSLPDGASRLEVVDAEFGDLQSYCPIPSAAEVSVGAETVTTKVREGRITVSFRLDRHEELRGISAVVAVEGVAESGAVPRRGGRWLPAAVACLAVVLGGAWLASREPSWTDRAGASLLGIAPDESEAVTFVSLPSAGSGASERIVVRAPAERHVYLDVRVSGSGGPYLRVGDGAALGPGLWGWSVGQLPADVAGSSRPVVLRAAACPGGAERADADDCSFATQSMGR